jgi:hypothetical protein
MVGVYRRPGRWATSSAILDDTAHNQGIHVNADTEVRRDRHDIAIAEHL